MRARDRSTRSFVRSTPASGWCSPRFLRGSIVQAQHNAHVHGLIYNAERALSWRVRAGATYAPLHMPPGGNLGALDIDVGRVAGDVAGVGAVAQADVAGLAPRGAPRVAHLPVPGVNKCEDGMRDGRCSGCGVGRGACVRDGWSGVETRKRARPERVCGRVGRAFGTGRWATTTMARWTH